MRLLRTSATSQAGGRRSMVEHDFAKPRKSMASSQESERSVPFSAKTELIAAR